MFINYWTNNKLLFKIIYKVKNMKKIFDKKVKIFGLFISVFSFLASCSTSRKDENNDSSEREEAIVTRILEESDPIAEIHVGPFEPLDGEEVKEVNSNAKTYGSSKISAKAVLQHSNDGKFKNNFDTRLSLTTKALYYSADMIDLKK